MRAVLIVTLALSGCTLFGSDYPDDTCQSDLDCFRAQGEFCNAEVGRCEQLPDAAPTFDARPTPDAPPAPDAAATDASPGADASPDAN